MIYGYLVSIVKDYNSNKTKKRCYNNAFGSLGYIQFDPIGSPGPHVDLGILGLRSRLEAASH